MHSLHFKLCFLKSILNENSLSIHEDNIEYISWPLNVGKLKAGGDLGYSLHWADRQGAQLQLGLGI